MTRAEVRAEARARSARTLVQGAALTVLVAVLLAVANVIDDWTGAQLLDAASWGALAVTAGTAALQAIAAWVHANLRPPIAS